MAWDTHTWLDGIGALVVALVVTIVAGLPGVVTGAILLTLWYTMPTVYGVAFGHLIVAALFTDGVSLQYLLPAEAGLCALLVGPALNLDHPWWRVLVTSGGAISVGMATLVVYRWRGAYWQAIAVLAIGCAIAAYGMHRYERVALGYVEEP